MSARRRVRPYWPAATDCPDPALPDPKRLDRLRAKAGGLVAREMAAMSLEASNAVWAQAMRAIAGTQGEADDRPKEKVPADAAGEYYLSAADGIIAHLRISGTLNGRQCDAAAELARLYGIGGGRSPWRSSGGADRPEEAVADARRQFDDLLRQAPRRTQWALTVLAMGEWMADRDPRPLWRDGLDAVALRLYGAEQEGTR